MSNVPSPGEPTEPQTPGEPPAMVVIPRTWKPVVGRSKHKMTGWTLHLETCSFVRNSTRKMPAPTVPHPHTIPCEYCRPTGEPARKFTRTYTEESAAQATVARTATAAAKGMHVNTYTPTKDGFTATCRVCGITATAPTRHSARLKTYRLHVRARREAS